jgi:hypothetical protein
MSYNLLFPEKIFTNATMTGTSTLTSAVTEIKNQDNIGFQLQWSGSPTGTFSVEVSMDYFADINGNVVNPGIWTTVPVSYWNGTSYTTSTTVPTSVGSPIYIDLNQLSATYIRVQYTNSASTGTLNGYVDGKGV